MKFIIDRIEGNFAVCECEDESFIDIPLSDLYSDAKAGDHIVFENQKYTHDYKSEEAARKRNIELQRSLFEN